MNGMEGKSYIEKTDYREGVIRQITALLCLITIFMQIAVPRFIQLPLLQIPFHFSVQFITIVAIFFSSFLGEHNTSKKPSVSRIIYRLFIFILIIELASTILTPLPQFWVALIRDIILVKCMFFVGRYMATYKYSGISILFIELTLFASFLLAIIEQALKFTTQSVIAKAYGAAANAQVAQLSDVHLRGSGLRSTGLFEHPIVMSVAAGALIPWILATSLRRRTVVGYVYAILFISVVVLAAYFSRSRTAILAVGVGVSVFVIVRSINQLRRGKPTLVLLAMTSAAISAPEIITYIMLKFIGTNADEAASTNLRAQMWSKASNYLVDSPLIGWGMGNDVYIAGIRRGNIVTIDDSYLSAFLTVGGIGLITFLALGVIASVSAFRTYYRQGDTPLGLNALAVCCAILVIYAGQITNSVDHMIGVLYCLIGYWSIKLATEKVNKKYTAA